MSRSEREIGGEAVHAGCPPRRRLPVGLAARGLVWRLARPRHEFFAWVPLSTVVVFGLNNLLLKSEFPGVVTGKLSDFAFCFFFPLFVSALLEVVRSWPRKRRVLVGAGLTVLSLVLVKTSTLMSNLLDGALALVNPLFGMPPSTNVVDPSDLVALPMVLLALWFSGLVEPEREVPAPC